MMSRRGSSYNNEAPGKGSLWVSLRKPALMRPGGEEEGSGREKVGWGGTQTGSEL